MISANQAYKLYEESEVVLEQVLAQIDPLIRKLASAGKREYVCYIEGYWVSSASQCYITPKQLAIST